ncbi:MULTISPECIES: iron-sulfur cluster assembly accessory protein [Pseudomonas]|uniref:Iron-sulfur cluster assembly accessory protein n=1 Tax=Pseudomonas kuykendallii TaxID=1007099 RepID=A0A2W5CXR6_9PSED|nr:MULTISPECIES: iron-sulfur cluster assembly accessory protein [Pseudomonas]PZP22284.1 MAG: iron-sulfur cluster assembly accessory protein [Pseudomonas kuykendallii]
MINLTAQAEQAIHRFIQGAEGQVAGLRVAVAGGGCSGLQYALRLESSQEEDDLVLTIGSVTLLVDPLSAPSLDGCNIDFVDSLAGSGFQFSNPNAKTQCGCGKSFAA